MRALSRGQGADHGVTGLMVGGQGQTSPPVIHRAGALDAIAIGLAIGHNRDNRAISVPGM